MSQQEKLLILQGGGSLGAYECGVYKALEEKGIFFDAVGGVSIGAVNASIIASSEKGKAAGVLEKFWDEIALAVPPIPQEDFRRYFSALYPFFFGHSKLFIPRWFIPGMAMYPFSWTSYYDTRPMKGILGKYIDFGHLATNEIRLFLTAVNVETGELEIFDSSNERITVEHVLASGSLPPWLPWTFVNGKAYWDGGIIGNTPLIPILERLTTECVLNQKDITSRHVYAVDLFPSKGRLPTNMREVMGRYKDILYSDRIENATRLSRMMTLSSQALLLIKELLTHVSEDEAKRVRKSPLFHELSCNSCEIKITRIAHSGEEDTGFHFSYDYDFSQETIHRHLAQGHKDTMKILN